MRRRKREPEIPDARGRKVGDGQPPIDWRKEFGVELFDLPPKDMLAMCEEIYQARLRRLKWSLAPGAALLWSRTNDAIMAARASLEQLYADA